MKYIRAKSLKENAIIIDLLSDQSYKIEHIKGAKNFSIYEMDFSEKIKNTFPDKKTILYIYGLSNDTKESEVAYNVLEELGYKNIYIIDDGLNGWKKLGLPFIKGKSKIEFNGKYVVSNEESRVEWIGRNIGNKHNGNLKFKEGYLLLDKGLITEGEFVIDMTSIDNFDLKESEFKNMLINHLKSKDFFDIDKFPTSTIKFLKFEKIKDVASKPNYNIMAELTIKGITNNIGFHAHIHEKDESLVINAHLDINRTNWNIMYGSEKFFARLGGHIIDDIISIDIIVFAKKSDKKDL
ncbi:MAG: YceI family protein [Candidatus Gracilibacteria bacterium]